MIERPGKGAFLLQKKIKTKRNYKKRKTYPLKEEIN
jgi:hypothetical protein